MNTLKIKQQEITSKDTALYQVPALHKFLAKNNMLNSNDVVLDFGCGKGLGRNVLPCKVDNYDPYNEWNEYNKNTKYDVIICANVLNVLTDDILSQVIAQLKELATLNNSTILISIYEGKRNGIGGATTKGYQRNEKTANYIPALETVFGNSAKIERFNGNFIKVTL